MVGVYIEPKHMTTLLPRGPRVIKELYIYTFLLYTPFLHPPCQLQSTNKVPPYLGVHLVHSIALHNASDAGRDTQLTFNTCSLLSSPPFLLSADDFICRNTCATGKQKVAFQSPFATWIGPSYSGHVFKTAQWSRTLEFFRKLY